MVRIYGVVVTYKPDTETLEKLIQSIYSQLSKLIIVDNTPDGSKNLEKFSTLPNIEIVYLRNNYGIAYAQNIGIKKSLEEKANYILLSDQDTIYPVDYVKSMIDCFRYEKVAAAGPVYINTVTGELSPIIKNYFKKEYVTSGKHEVFQMIASGMIINSLYIKDIGFMREDLFIDWVDLEWCWRARKKGYKLIVNADVKIEHNLGYKSRTILGKKIALRNHIRHYYMVRNGFYLSLYSHDLDIIHKLILFIKSVIYLIAFPILAKPHLKNLRCTLKGFFDGITGKLGQLNEKCH